MFSRIIIICFVLSGCCALKQVKNVFIEDPLDTAYYRTSKKLQKHFSGVRTYDVASLVYEARILSARLKQAQKIDMANKIDSYVDVLTYGNHTIQESIYDTLILAKTPCVKDL